jgi:hypothetical protein
MVAVVLFFASIIMTLAIPFLLLAIIYRLVRHFDAGRDIYRAPYDKLPDNSDKTPPEVD